MTDSDDTVLTEGHGTIEDTAPIAVRRVSQTEPARKLTAERALPPQAPPVTDIHLLEYRLPEVPSGTVVRYKPRTDPEIAHVPEFDASWRIRQRTPRALAPGEVVAHQRDDLRLWRRRAFITVVSVSVVVIAGCILGIWALQRL